MVDCWDTAICRAATPCHRAGSSAGASIINGGGEYVSLAEIFLRKLLRFCLSRLAIGSQNRTASGENSRCNKKAHPAFRQDARKIACGYFQANGTNLVHFAPKSSVSCNFISYLRHKISQSASSSGRKQPSFQSLLNLLISHNRSKRGFFLKRYIPINSCCFSVDWSINWCKWCRSFYPHSRNATYSLDTLLYSLLKYESRPSNSDCLSPFVTSV